MTSLLTGRPGTRLGTAPAEDPRHRRPLGLTAALGGAAAAGSVLLVCLAIGVTGWFLSDAGSHGAPRDGLRAGALAWLMAHGSGVRVPAASGAVGQGVAVTAIPLLLTIICAWAIWRIASRVGDSISGHGPDSDAIADGSRDWTVPLATAAFAAGYAVVVLVTTSLAGTAATAPSGTRALFWTFVLSLLVAGPAIAVGSGRLAIWAAFVPGGVRAAAATARSILLVFALTSFLAFATALVLDLSTAVNVLSELHLSGGETVLFLGLSLLVVPNAVGFAGSYLLGPGFMVGTHTLVTPTAVVLGPLPVFPLFAALPSIGPTPSWTPWLMALPILVAALATAWAQRRRPTTSWSEAAIRGCAGGITAGVVLGFLLARSGGAVGPGRMAHLGPFAFDALVHAVTAFGLGGLAGAVAMTAWQRRRLT